MERNAKRANFVATAEDWRWSSLNRRMFGTAKQKKFLDSWPVEPCCDYMKWVNEEQPKEEVEVIRMSVTRGRPYGNEVWTGSMTERLGLQSAWRERGRPRTMV